MNKIFKFISITYAIIFTLNSFLLLNNFFIVYSESPSILFSIVNSIFQLIFFIFSLICYFLLFICPNLPRKILLPLTITSFMIFTFNSLVSFFYIFKPFLMLVPFFINFILGGYFIIKTLRTKQKGWNYSFYEIVRNFLKFAFYNLFVIVPGFMIYFFILAYFTVNVSLQGVITFGLNAIYAKEEILIKDNKKVILIPMSHIAEKEFYLSVKNNLPEKNVIMLTEGVSDNHNLLKTKFNYKNISSLMGLSSQTNEFIINKKTIKIMNADLDVINFSKETIYLLNLVGRYINSKFADNQAFIELNSIMSKRTSAKNFFYDLLNKRNKNLLDVIYHNLEGYNNIVIPWGAKHIPQIKQEILKKGFNLYSSRQIPVIHYVTLIERIGKIIGRTQNNFPANKANDQKN